MISDLTEAGQKIFTADWEYYKQCQADYKK
jgi:hypothetical protein